VDHGIHLRIALNPGKPLFQTKNKIGSQAFALLFIPEMSFFDICFSIRTDQQFIFHSEALSLCLISSHELPSWGDAW
jgi:hypothetical protein